MDTSPNTHPNVVDETTNSRVIIDVKEIELLIVSIETLKRQNKNSRKDDVFVLVKDSLTMESFEKSLELL